MGVFVLRNEGPQRDKTFMMSYSIASPALPIAPASRGRRMFCMASITDAVQVQASGLDTVLNGSQFLSEQATQHLGP